jgi:Tfp pilus assembly protein PilV
MRPEPAADRGSQAGFALLEVMISAGITAIAVLGLAVLFSYGQGFVRAEGDQRVALFLAQKRLEDMRSIGLAQAIEETNVAIPGFPDFRRTTTIAGGTDLDGSGLTPRTITVSVRSIAREAGPVSVIAVVYPH